MNESWNIGPLMKAARKFRKFNQADVARAIGCSQSALSKMEHNLLVPSAPQWFLFVRFTAIPPESLERGFIDRHARLKFNDPDVSRGFKIPKRYRHFRAQKVREVYPFLKYFEKNNGGRAQQFIERTELEAEFFLDFDNLLNFQVIIDLFQFLREGAGVSEAELRKLVALGHDDIYWDHLGVMLKDLDSPTKVALEFAQEQPFFQSDFDLTVELEDRGVVVTYVPGGHMKEFQKAADPVIKQALNDYRRLTLEALMARARGLSVRVEEISGEAHGFGARFIISSLV